jgi:general secretion pathway protein K
VATLAGSMVWQQWRAIQVEAAERARTQSAWILSGALDWARLILREDAKNDAAHPPSVDHLGEPWAVPLAEARLSTFLAVDKDNTDDAPDAFLSGVITDAMARYNLMNLLDATGGINKQELATLERLCTTVGVSADVASRIAVALRDAAPPVPPAPGASAPAFVPPADPPLMPQSASQLGWLGIDAESLRALDPYIVLIPDTLRFPNSALVNVNTAPREVLVAVVEQLDLATAERIIQSRQRVPLKNVADLAALAPGVPPANLNRLAFSSNYFHVRGRLRLGDIALEQRSLVKRNGPIVVVLQRERVSSREQAGS